MVTDPILGIAPTVKVPFCIVTGIMLGTSLYKAALSSVRGLVLPEVAIAVTSNVIFTSAPLPFAIPVGLAMDIFTRPNVRLFTKVKSDVSVVLSTLFAVKMFEL